MSKYRIVDGIIVSFMFLLMASIAQAGLTDALIAYYPFDMNANDLSGYENNATAYNEFEYVDGVASGAIRLVGSGHTGLNGGHVILPYIALNEFSAFTISMWVNHEGVSSPVGDRFIGFGAQLDCNGSGNIVSICFNDAFPNCSLSYQVGDMSSGGTGGRVDLPYPSSFIDHWYHLALVADRGTLTGFLNGNYVGSDSYELESMFPVAGIGCSWFNCGGSDANRFIGMIDDVGIWDRALTLNEIATIYTNGLAGQPIPEPTTLIILGLGGIAVTHPRWGCGRVRPGRY